MIRIIKNIIIIILVVSFIFVASVVAMGMKGFSVVTDSMEPALKKGDAVFVKKCSFDDISVGDILTVRFSDGSSTFTHRVVEIDRQKGVFYTQGDNSPQKDGASKGQDIVGKVLFHLPFAGYLSMWISNRKNIAIILLVIIFAFTLIRVVSYKIGKREVTKNE